ncbi:hypothetical protein BJ878DRAFT_546739 [Calycina marina]|uniref:Tyrosinase copper-binding domain-containing protein n=1 Tax=Calycina marina TaxID=1763456 RepID=A0A9P8CAX6_9HELO|nr:hypothetical protein BJ878DRAFT_546739 [Calycina marina]
MRASILLLAVSAAVSASILPRAAPAPALPASAFVTFKVVPIEQARADALEYNRTHSTAGKDVQRLSASTVEPADAASCSASPNIRFEWRNYQATDRLAFVTAIKCLINLPPSGTLPPAKNRYEDLVRLHQLYMPNVHGNAKFLLWHRYFVWTFEQVLRTECGFNRAFPWWDETLDAGEFGQSDMFTNDNYFGHLPTVPNCIVSGAFSGLVCNIGPGTSTTTPHCLTRTLDESLTAQCNAGYVNLCNSQTDYASFESCFEGGPHAYGHNGIGSVMSDVSASASDPVFFMHHLFVDHTFRIWQNGNVAARTTSINGVDASGTPLTLDTIVYMGGIRPNVAVRDILNTLGGVSIGGVPFCYRYDY